MQKITQCLWFDSNAEEAVNFYLSIFKNSKIHNISHYSEEGVNASGMKKGSVMVISFSLEGQKFMALNGGPVFKFTPALSLVVHCKSQKEIDWFYDKLSEGGKPGQCGWLEDRFGLSWQIVPAVLEDFMSDNDVEKTGRVMKELLKMNKIKIDVLKKAFDGA